MDVIDEKNRGLPFKSWAKPARSCLTCLQCIDVIWILFEMSNKNFGFNWYPVTPDAKALKVCQKPGQRIAKTNEPYPFRDVASALYFVTAKWSCSVVKKPTKDMASLST